jgi:outer membrane protein assembly factor BamB
MKNVWSHLQNGSLLLSLCVLCAFARNASAADWSFWRGPHQNGVSDDKNLPDTWSPDPTAPNNNLVWKAPVGGRTTPIIMNGRVYFITNAGEGISEQERVVCLDADTGKQIWEHRFNVWLTDIVSVRLGWTNVVGDPETGNVYAHGTQGMLFCFDKDGKILWSHSMTEEYGRISGYGGRVTSPIIDGDLCILGMLNASWGELARGGNRFVAFDKRTGAVRWWGSTGLPPKDSYNSVSIVVDISGERLLISGGGDGAVHAFKVNTGEKVWTYGFGTGAINPSPVVDGTRVYISHGDENPDTNARGRIICLDAGKVTAGKPALVWKKDGVRAKFASPIIHEGRLYVADETATLLCYDAATGKQLWRHKYGRNAKGSPVLADGKLYVGEVNGKFHILKPSDKGCEELHSQFFSGANGIDVEINGSAAVANGRVYFMTRDETYCIGKKDATATLTRPRSTGANAAGANAAPPTHLQIVPSDVVVSPGGSMSFTARLYDAHGNFVREAKPEWSVGPMQAPPPLPNQPAPPGPQPPPLKGEITADGKLAVDKTPGQFGTVVAKADGLTGLARIRVAPVLPYSQDFRKVPENRSPAGWVNTQGKFAVRKIEGQNVLVKTATNPSPLVARANAFITMPTATDYTIQADILGSKVNDDMPDMGVVAKRYTFMLDGNKQQLRLISWDAIPRVDKTIAYAWKPNQWYRLKLTVEVQGDKAIARGKIWNPSDHEPADWTVTFTDPVPNKEGSPALYANATGILEGKTGAEVFFANVSVTPIKKAAAVSGQ